MFFLTHNAPPSFSASFLSVPPSPYTFSGLRTNISRQDEEENRRRQWWWWLGGVESASLFLCLLPTSEALTASEGLTWCQCQQFEASLTTIFTLATLQQKSPQDSDFNRWAHTWQLLLCLHISLLHTYSENGFQQNRLGVLSNYTKSSYFYSTY